MISNLFLLMMIAHLVGDYYLQGKEMAEDKQNKPKKLILHLLIYAGCALLFFLPIVKTGIILYLLMFVLAHTFIDITKFFIQKKFGENYWIYIGDQALHIISISAIAMWFESSAKTVEVFDFIMDTLKNADISYVMFLKVTLLLLITLKPVNITFKKVFFKESEKEEDEDDVVFINKEISKKQIDLGALMGCMERLFTVIFLMLGEYAAIGLVLTGKSIARNKDNVDMEYYIVGTFFSLLWALIAYLLIMHLM